MHETALCWPLCWALVDEVKKRNAPASSSRSDATITPSTRTAMSTPSNREQSQPALFRASTPTPSVASAGGAAKKGGSKKGKKSRAASTAPSAAGDGQINGVQWASPIQASVSDPTGIGGPGESNAPVMPVSAGALPGSAGKAGVDDDGEGDEDKEDLLPDMADDDYSAQLSWQSQTKDNLK